MTSKETPSKAKNTQDPGFRTALLEAINEATPDGMLVVDARGKIISYNRRFAEMWNMPKKIIDAKNDAAALKFAMTQLVDPQSFIDRVNYLYSHPKESSHEEVMFKDGRVFERYGAAVKDDRGQYYGWAWHFHDITNRKIIEHEVLKAKAEAEIEHERFKALIEHSSDAIALTDVQGIIIYVSFSVRNVLGYTESEMLGKPGSLFVHPEDLPMAQQKLGSIMQAVGRAKTIEHRAAHKDGSIKWLETTATNLIDEPSVRAIVTNFRDITERKLAEVELRNARDQLSTALAAGTIATWKWDIAKNLVYGDKNMAKFFGVKASVVANGLPASAFIGGVHPDDQPTVARYVADVVKTGAKYETEYRLINKKGVVRWVIARGKVDYNSAGKALYFDGVLMDITVRKLTEQKLLETEERFRQLADSMPQIVWTARPDGYIDYYNKQWYKYTGLKKVTKNQTWKSILHPDDREVYNSTWNKSVTTGKAHQLEYRFKNRRKPGTYRWFLGRAVPISDKNGKITKWFGTCTDIDDIRRTHKRKNELEKIAASLTKQRQQLVELNNAKDEFISIASHQLRTPATGVKQYIGMLLEGYAGTLNPVQEKFLRNAYESNERQINTVNDLLRVATVDAGKVVLMFESTDLIDLIKNILKEHTSKFAERTQKVIFKPEHQSLVAKIDARKMRMVLENIIDNASKYTYEGKSIEVSVAKSDLSIDISIKDQGVGIGKLDQQKIFGKFSSIENSLTVVAGGTGIGLYWAKKIVELHGGTIEVISTPKKGSTFTIKIPTNKKA